MRILQLGRFYPPELGGIETVIFEIVEGLNANNIRCDVLCSNKINRLEISNTRNYKIVRAPSLTHVLSTSISPALIFQLRKLVKEYDIIHLHHPDPMATLALLLCRPGGKQKIIVHWHSDIIRQKFTLFFYRPIQEWLLKRCNRIVVTSQNYLDTSKHLTKYWGKAEVVPIGISAEMNSNARKLDELKKSFKGKKIIFGLGRHVYYKGFEYLIESAEYLDDNYLIIIGGDGPLGPSLMAKVQEKGLQSRVVFTGRIPFDEIHSYFELCDIFCLPSVERSEAFGVVLLEAMSLGKPIVATNIPGSGVNWVNQDNETGLNVTPQDPKALADAFVKIMSNPAVMKKFSERGKSRYLTKFTREAMVDQLISLYSRVLKS
jgi:glycosyltransferase involved in cell wall biosynthesis